MAAGIQRPGNGDSTMRLKLFNGVLAGLAVTAVSALSGCGEPTSAPPATTTAGGQVVEIVARGLQFIAPDEIPSGWTTFRFRNESSMTHFAVIERLPDGVGIKEQQEQAAPIFQQGMDLLTAGDAAAATEKFGELPEWFGQIVFMGGPGLTGPGQVSETTVYLDPGTYLLECYVKTNGVFHSYNPAPDAYGMVHEFTVMETANGLSQPKADIRITVSAERGIEVEGDPTPGEHTVLILFADQKVYENFVGHDVHLVRLGDDTDLERLAAWMDWSRPGGLETPAPALFLGGANEMPAAHSAYYSVSLEPGHYAWIAEVPDPAGKGMLRTFEVTTSSASGY